LDTEQEFHHLEVANVQDVMVVRLLDAALDQLSLILAVNSELSQLIASTGVRNVLLDLEPVSMVSSVMLGKLISLQSRLKSNGARLVLCSLHPQVQEICAITNLNQLFDIQADRSLGLAALGVDSAP
jgi:anti-sigma B factor antagonist